MIFWRCLVYTLLFLFSVLVLSFAEMVDAAPLDVMPLQPDQVFSARQLIEPDLDL